MENVVETITVYTSPSCPYCVMAKRLLASRERSYEEVDISRDPARLQEMLTLSGRRTVPQIFIGGQHVGGYDDLVRFDQQGQLAG